MPNTYQEAQKEYPGEKLHNYRVTWHRGKETIYAPDREEAIEYYEKKYPKRVVSDIEEQW